jgi:uncharacterized membrane protein
MPSGGEPLEQEFSFDVLQYHALEMDLTYTVTTLTQGGTTGIEVHLRNMGNGEEEVTVLVPELPSLWTFDLESDTLTLPAFGDRRINLAVHTSRETPGGGYNIRIMARYGPPPVSSVHEDVTITILTRADLTVKDGQVSLAMVEVSEGDLVQASVEVENLGETAAMDVYVQFYVDGTPLSQPVYLPELAPGASEAILGSWYANVTGLHAISVTVDSTNDVDETNEGNNEASVQINVQPVVLQTSPGFGPVLLLVALAALAVLAGAWRRRVLQQR